MSYYPYFPCEIPTDEREVMFIANDEVRANFVKTAEKLSKRMKLLNEALNCAATASPEAFAASAKVLFDKASSKAFDAMTPDALARAVDVLAQMDSTSYPPRCEWPNAIPIFDCRFVSNEDWETVRMVGLGGSDAASILNCSPYKTSLDTFLDKTGRVLKGNDAGKQVIFDRGHMMEPLVIDAFCRTFGARQIPEYRMFRSTRYPHCTANIDAIAEMPGGKLVVFEAKTTIEDNWAAWTQGSVPVQYIPQTRQYPAVLNDDRIIGTYIGCLFTKDYQLSNKYCGSTYNGEDFKCTFIPRDKDEEDAQMEEMELFWHDCVEMDIEPENTGDAARNLESFNSTIGAADKKAPPVNLPIDQWGEKAEKILELAQRIKIAQGTVDSIKELKKEAELDFIKELGTSVEGRILLSDGERYVEVKNSPRSRESVDSKELKVMIDALGGYGVPDAFLDKMRGCFTKNEEATRVFSLKVKNLPKKK